MPEFAKDLQTFRDATAHMIDVALAQEAELPELTAGTVFPAELFAQLLMEHLPIEGMDFVSKQFWLRVAEHIGPDYIAMFKHVGAFMNKVDEF